MPLITDRSDAGAQEGNWRGVKQIGSGSSRARPCASWFKCGASTSRAARAQLQPAVGNTGSAGPVTTAAR
jgi:hypothetical protein